MPKDFTLHTHRHRITLDANVEMKCDIIILPKTIKINQIPYIAMEFILDFNKTKLK